MDPPRSGDRRVQLQGERSRQASGANRACAGGESGRNCTRFLFDLTFERSMRSADHHPGRGLPLRASSAMGQRLRRRGCKTLFHIRGRFCSPGNTERLLRRLSCDGRSNSALLPFRNPCARNELPRTSTSSTLRLHPRRFKQSTRSIPASAADQTRSK